MLSRGRQTNPFAGLRPSWFAICSADVQRIPVGFVVGLYRALTGTADGHASSAFVRLANARCQFWHDPNVLNPEAAARCAAVQPAATPAALPKYVNRSRQSETVFSVVASGNDADGTIPSRIPG